MTRTGAVLAPNAHSGQVPTAERAVLEELVERTPECATARVDLRPRLPYMVVCVRERLPGEDRPVPEERPALAALQALVEHIDEIREHTRGLESD